MQLLNTIRIEEKKSIFIGYIYEISNIDEINEVLSFIKTLNKNAKHIPYAYRLNNTAKKSDDKEPSGTAGLPIYSVLERSNLNNKIIVVVRYYGGTKLGSGLLTRTYLKCASMLLKNELFN